MTSIRTLLAPTLLLALVGVSATAMAQDDMGAVGRGPGFGIGYNAMLTGPSGLSAVYDAGQWHADAVLGVAGGDDTDFEIGVRGFYHLHSTAMSDFSLGGGIGVTHNDFGADSADTFHIEIGVQIRAFLTSNVSINGFGGLGILAGDGDGFVLDAQPLAGLGFTYYFF